ncbi:SKP1-like protein 1A [Euphorbia peplus]|nr:SKP1-like protein 1A [Euphorbia peplus]
MSPVTVFSLLFLILSLRFLTSSYNFWFRLSLSSVTVKISVNVPVSETPSSKKIVLKSSEGVSFEVDEVVALQSETIKHMIENGYTGNEISLPNITCNILAKVIEYSKKHVQYSKFGDRAVDQLNAWDANFVNLHPNTLLHLARAAYHLKIMGLFDLTCKAIADTMIKGKTKEEIPKAINIKNDFTPEEVEEVRRETEWAFL